MTGAGFIRIDEGAGEGGDNGAEHRLHAGGQRLRQAVHRHHFPLRFSSGDSRMSIPSEDEISHFLTNQLAFWNAGRRQDMTDLYRKYAGDQLVIEYVGEPIGDGWASYNHMWDTYGGKV